MLQAAASVNNLLTWYTIQKADDAGVIPNVSPDKDLDSSPAVFAIQFAIRADAWPVAVD